MKILILALLFTGCGWTNQTTIESRQAIERREATRRACAVVDPDPDAPYDLEAGDAWFRGQCLKFYAEERGRQQEEARLAEEQERQAEARRKTLAIIAAGLGGFAEGMKAHSDAVLQSRPTIIHCDKPDYFGEQDCRVK